MKLDASFVRYLEADDLRVLTAVEVGSRNHEVVPTQLITNVSKLRQGGAHRVLSELCKHKLVARENAANNRAYDGYRLTYGGYDYLALHTFSQRGSIAKVGRQIGTGKESDIYLCEAGEMESNVDDNKDFIEGSNEVAPAKPGELVVLKIQRLGRTSFRTVRSNRDYAGRGRSAKSASWMYLSRLAAQKEWAFMKALYSLDFPVPRPIDQNRHCVVMGLIDGILLDNAHLEDLFDESEDESISADLKIQRIAELYDTLISLIVRLAEHGLIHGDFNEFNLLLERDTRRIVVIDFPQMTSTAHPNASDYFARDVNCIRDFMRRRFGFEASRWPLFERDVRIVQGNIDKLVEASGFHLSKEAESGTLSEFEIQSESEPFSESESQSESESDQC